MPGVFPTVFRTGLSSVLLSFTNGPLSRRHQTRRAAKGLGRDPDKVSFRFCKTIKSKTVRCGFVGVESLCSVKEFFPFCVYCACAP